IRSRQRQSLALWKAVRHLTYRETHPARSRHFPLGLLIGAPSAFPADGVSLPLRFTKSPQQSNRPLPWATCWQTGTRSPKAEPKHLASENRRNEYSLKQVSAYAAEPEALRCEPLKAALVGALYGARLS